MRHVWFGLGLLLALVISLPVAFVFQFHECKSGMLELETACLAHNSFGVKVSLVSIVVIALIAIALHICRSKWTISAVLAVPVSGWILTYFWNHALA